MRRFRGLLSTVSAVALLGCAAADSIGPRVVSEFAPDVATAAKNNEDGIPKSAKVYCVNETSCYAAAFDFTDYHGLYTVFTVYLQNLQGTYPPGGPSEPLRLNTFGMVFFDAQEDPDFVDSPNISLSGSGVGIVQAGETNFWGHDGPSAGQNRDNWMVNFYGIIGCSLPAPYPLMQFAFRTCPSQGLDGWVKFDITLRHLGLSDDPPKQRPVRFKDFFFYFGGLFGDVCRIGGKQPGTCTELSYRSVMR